MAFSDSLSPLGKYILYFLSSAADETSMQSSNRKFCESHIMEKRAKKVLLINSFSSSFGKCFCKVIPLGLHLYLLGYSTLRQTLRRKGNVFLIGKFDNSEQTLKRTGTANDQSLMIGRGIKKGSPIILRCIFVWPDQAHSGI